MKDKVGRARREPFDEIDTSEEFHKPLLARGWRLLFSTRHPSGDDLEVAKHMYEFGAEEDIAQAEELARRDGRDERQIPRI